MPRILGASTYSENFPGADVSDEEWAFMRAMSAYQRRWNRRYPSWREVLHVAACLGYRKVAAAVPADARPPTVAELRLLDAAWREFQTRSTKSESHDAPPEAEPPSSEAPPNLESA